MVLQLPWNELALVSTTWIVIVLALGITARVIGRWQEARPLLRANLLTAILILAALVPLLCVMKFESIWQVDPQPWSPAPESAAAPADQTPTTSPALEPSVVEAPVSSVSTSGAPMASYIVPILVALWLLGLIVATSRLVIRHARLRRLLRGCMPVSPTVHETIQATARKVFPRLGRVLVREHQSVERPFVCGLWRPTLVLPEPVSDSNRSDIVPVVIHELAHVARRDLWVGHLEDLLHCVLWFHLAFRWIRMELARAREEVCDNFVLAHVGNRQYAETLLRVSLLGNRDAALPGLTLLEKDWRLEDRIRGLLQPERNRMTNASFYSKLSLSLLLVCCSAAVVIGRPTILAQSLSLEAPSSPPLSARNEATSLKLATTKLSFEVSGLKLNELTGFLATVSGLRFEALEFAETLDLGLFDNMALSELLGVACTKYRLEYRLAEGVVRIGPLGTVKGAVDPRTLPSTREWQAVQAKLKGPVPSSITELTFQGLVNAYRNLEIPVSIDWKKLGNKCSPDERVSLAPAKKASHHEYLSTLFKSRGAAVVNYHGTFVVTNAGTAAALQAKAAQESSESQ